MKNIVKIKGTKSGVIVMLDKESTYEEIVEAVTEKFSSAAAFLGNARVTVKFEGKKMSDLEKFKLVDIISENTDLDIICITDDDIETEERLNKTLEKQLNNLSSNAGQFYKGNLRAGQVIDFETSVIVLGDVLEGAQIVSKGNIVVLGELSGSAFAGAGGNEETFIAALKMNESKLRICDSTLITDKKRKFRRNNGAQIAVCKKGVIYKESLSYDLIADILID